MTTSGYGNGGTVLADRPNLNAVTLRYGKRATLDLSIQNITDFDAAVGPNYENRRSAIDELAVFHVGPRLKGIANLR